MKNAAPIAENRTLISRSLFKEGMRAVESKDYRKGIRKLIFVLIVLYVAVAAWLLYTGGSLIFLFGEAIFLGAILFWLAVSLPNTRYRSKYNTMTGGSNDPPERLITFYEDHLSVTDSAEKTTLITYDEISGWQETRNLYVLCCSSGYLLISKNGFSLGGFDVVRSNLHHKVQ